MTLDIQSYVVPWGVGADAHGGRPRVPAGLRDAPKGPQTARGQTGAASRDLSAYIPTDGTHSLMRRTDSAAAGYLGGAQLKAPAKVTPPPACCQGGF